MPPSRRQALLSLLAAPFAGLLAGAGLAAPRPLRPTFQVQGCEWERQPEADRATWKATGNDYVIGVAFVRYDAAIPIESGRQPEAAWPDGVAARTLIGGGCLPPVPPGRRRRDVQVEVAFREDKGPGCKNIYYRYLEVPI